MVFLCQGDDFFAPQENAHSAYLTAAGRLQYVRVPASAPVDEETVDSVEPGTWICEVALWVHWKYVGSMSATMPCELIAVQAVGLLRVMAEHAVVKDLTYDYGWRFHRCVVSAVPPNAKWPSDIAVPCADFVEVVAWMQPEHRVIIGLKALHEFAGSRSWHPIHVTAKMGRLERQVKRGVVTLAQTGAGNLQRAAFLTAVRVMRPDGRLLARLAFWDGISRFGHGVCPKCSLPCSLQRCDESTEDAVDRLLETELLSLQENLHFTHVEHETLTTEAPHLSMLTKYFTTLHHASLDVPTQQEDSTPLQSSQPPVKRSLEGRASEFGCQSSEGVADRPFKVSHINAFVLPSQSLRERPRVKNTSPCSSEASTDDEGPGVDEGLGSEKQEQPRWCYVYAWLSSGELSRLSAPSGERSLRAVIETIDFGRLASEQWMFGRESDAQGDVRRATL